MFRQSVSPRHLLLALALTSLVAASASIFLHKCQRAQTEQQRTREVNEMLAKIQQNGQSTFVVDRDALAVAGEDAPALPQREVSPTDLPSSGLPSTDHPAAPRPGASKPNHFSDADNTYTLTAAGTLFIPSIDCELPLWNGAGTLELRYGAGRMPVSAEVGQPGNLVIFGHRMKRYGSLFNRLGEVQIGDTVSIVQNEKHYTYVIDQILTIDPSELSRYIQNEGDSARITLVTCTPTGVGSHRLLLMGHLESD